MDLPQWMRLALEALTTWDAAGGICGAIVLLAVYWALQFLWRFAPRIRDLKRACRILEQAGNEEEFAAHFEDIHSAAAQNRTLGHAWSEFAETLIFPATEDEEEVVRNSEKPNTFFNRSSLLGGMNLRFYNSLPNLLTGAGILFTFVGLVAGILLASRGLAADSIEQQRGALQDLLGGAGLAFSTSIVGLLTSIGFSAFEKRQIHRFDYFCARWTNTLDARLRRITPEMIARDQLLEVRQQTRTLETFSDQLAFQIGKAIDEQVSQPMNATLEKIASSIESMRSDRDTSNQAALERMIEQFSETMSGAAGQELQALGQTLESLNSRLGKHADRLEVQSKESQQATARATEQLEGTLAEGARQINEAVGNIGETIRGIESVRGDVADMMKRSGQLAEDARRSHEALGEVTEPLRETAAHLAESSSSAREAGQEAAKAAEQIHQNIRELTQAQERITQAWSDYRQRFEGIDESLDATFRHLEDGLARYNESVSTFVSSIDQHTSDIVGQLSGAVAELRESIEELNEERAT